MIHFSFFFHHSKTCSIFRMTSCSIDREYSCVKLFNIFLSWYIVYLSTVILHWLTIAQKVSSAVNMMERFVVGQTSLSYSCSYYSSVLYSNKILPLARQWNLIFSIFQLFSTSELVSCQNKMFRTISSKISNFWFFHQKNAKVPGA